MMLGKLVTFYTYLWAGLNIGAVIGYLILGDWGWSAFYAVMSPLWVWLCYRQSKRVGWIK